MKRGVAPLLVKLLLALVGLSLLTLVASCASLLNLDGRASAVTDLCALLERCYGADFVPDCEASVGANLDGADPEPRSQWLVSFGEQSCLENCVNAWNCLDLKPVCQATASSCATDEQCCGFSQQDAACAGGRCCVADGRSCSTSEECCNAQCRDGICGENECKDSGETCLASSECCTGVCQPLSQTCSGSPCLPNGAECLDNEDCCDQFCDVFEEGFGICSGMQECLPQGADCELSNVPCCPGTECYPLANTSAFACLDGSCQELGTPCGSAGECCSGLCSPDLGLCASPGACDSDGSVCVFGGDCCSGACHNDQCCAPPTNCGHGVCQTGGALSPTCPCGECMTNDNCIAKVCAVDGFCCCNSWDDLCVQKVTDLCGIGCAMMP